MSVCSTYSSSKVSRKFTKVKNRRLSKILRRPFQESMNVGYDHGDPQGLWSRLIMVCWGYSKYVRLNETGRFFSTEADRDTHLRHHLYSSGNESLVFGSPVKTVTLRTSLAVWCRHFPHTSPYRRCRVLYRWVDLSLQSFTLSNPCLVRSLLTLVDRDHGRKLNDRTTLWGPEALTVTEGKGRNR